MGLLAVGSGSVGGKSKTKRGPGPEESDMAHQILKRLKHEKSRRSRDHKESLNFSIRAPGLPFKFVEIKKTLF